MNNTFGFLAGTRILMNNGFYKNIEDIEINDLIINGNGKITKVINKTKSIDNDLLEIRHNSYYEYMYFSQNVKCWIGDLSSVSKNTIQNQGYKNVLDKLSKTIPKQSKYKWKELSSERDYVLLLPNDIEFSFPNDFEIKLNKRIGGNNRPITISKLDSTIKPCYESGYLFGTFLGDGCASGITSWYFGLKEKDIVDKLSSCIKTIFNKDIKIKTVDNMHIVKFYYKPLADYLFTFGKKNNKRLPESLLVNDQGYLKGLYDGLLDSDGHCEDNGRSSLRNTSIYLIELFNILNIVLNKSMPNNHKCFKTIGGLKGTKIENIKDSYTSRALMNPQNRLTKEYQVIKLMDYEINNSTSDVYNIEVNDNTHSFIANNIIVHDSFKDFANE